MPMGSTHRRINTAASIPLAAGTLVLGWSPVYTLVMVAGYTFATYFMNPDLDLNSIGYQSWGWLRFIWWPYQKALGHRCWASHFPVVSTILRIAYLLWFPLLLLFLLSATVRSSVAHDDYPTWLLTVLPFIIVFVIGMVISDSLHAILDVSSTELKHILHGTHHHRHEHDNFFAHHNQRVIIRRRGDHRYRNERHHPQQHRRRR